jgi:hypothetical protein
MKGPVALPLSAPTLVAIVKLPDQVWSAVIHATTWTVTLPTSAPPGYTASND